MAAHVTFIIFFFLLGSCIGSFLNVIVWRLPRGEFPGEMRSHCPKCGHALAHALITDRKSVPEATRKKLDLLIGKYFV